MGKRTDALAAQPKQLSPEQERAEKRTRLLDAADANLAGLDALLTETDDLMSAIGYGRFS